MPRRRQPVNDASATTATGRGGRRGGRGRKRRVASPLNQVAGDVPAPVQSADLIVLVNAVTEAFRVMRAPQIDLSADMDAIKKAREQGLTDIANMLERRAKAFLTQTTLMITGVPEDTTPAPTPAPVNGATTTTATAPVVLAPTAPEMAPAPQA